MEDEWTRVISGDRLVKFTYFDLPEGTAFLTAQIAGHDVVYSVILRQVEHPFNRDDVERHFDYECPPILNWSNDDARHLVSVDVFACLRTACAGVATMIGVGPAEPRQRKSVQWWLGYNGSVAV
jgi:hypothetical protein